MFGLVTTRRYLRDTTALKAEADRQRDRANEANAVAGREVRNRRRYAELNADLDAAVTRLTGRVDALKRKLGIADAAAGIDHERAHVVGARLRTGHQAAARARKEPATAPAVETEPS